MYSYNHYDKIESIQQSMINNSVQYQQNKQPPHTIEHKKRQWHMPMKMYIFLKLLAKASNSLHITGIVQSFIYI